MYIDSSVCFLSLWSSMCKKGLSMLAEEDRPTLPQNLQLHARIFREDDKKTQRKWPCWTSDIAPPAQQLDTTSAVDYFMVWARVMELDWRVQDCVVSANRLDFLTFSPARLTPHDCIVNSTRSTANKAEIIMSENCWVHKGACIAIHIYQLHVTQGRRCSFQEGAISCNCR